MTANSSRNAEVLVQEVLTHAWRYCELHAAQRLSLFSFFLVVSGVVIARLAARVQLSGFTFRRLIGTGLGWLLAVVTFTFWKLDHLVGAFPCPMR